ncbi:hypothetical protein HMPREF3173_10260 [Pseudomonas sp. HMSC08G10]|uniref:zinc-finger-containing protein n=1 Tax=Pseudomonas sp. HMSC08G10 TaxID=1581141 RepID=UPI0008A47CE5|nr:zinc-finger-containing protein [Pseudomonas sp. HMSC08G10]OFS73859.1 hypothetical protein HMPREF3173_10260 [Pseudomonas sp. HMSC08G10]
MPIDPRANAPERIAAPAPLPHVSRRALKRVKNPLPAPCECRYCGDQVDLVCNSEIYNGRSYGDWPYAYLCSGCYAYVGLHPDTDIPLGTLADSALRAVRNRCKAVFHKHITDTGMGRTQAYRWLAEQMKIDVGACHFGWFEQADCERAEAIVKLSAPQTAMAMAFAKAAS